MKDIHAPLRGFLYTVITDKGYNCYENGAIPDDAPTPYVILADISSGENSNKTDFGNSVQSLLDIVTSVPKNIIGGSLLADTIAGNILETINSKTKHELVEGLQLLSTRVLQDFKIADVSDTHRIYRRLIRFQHLIMEV